jgi:UDP-3-O-[3-hydroxymyristoyl] glucosamine N-acyltransferase
MADPRFFVRAGPFTLAELAAKAGASLGPRASGEFLVHDVAATESAAPGLIVHLQSRKSAAHLAGCAGFAVIARGNDLESVEALPDEVLVSDQPLLAFVAIAELFYPPELQPDFASAGPAVDASAKLEPDVHLAPGAVVGPGAELGTGTRIGPNAVIGPGVRIGRRCRIGANASIRYALVGDGVIVHPGAAIGQDGFGYAPLPKGGYRRVPQIGRVILQDNVEVGASSTIDRGALGDTVIGEGTKVDNLVQIGHNCRIGRHVVIAAQVGISGSSTVGDFAVLGGQVGVADHITIGEKARIGAKAGVMSNVPAGAVYAGFPAMPRFQWLREVAWLNENVKKKGPKASPSVPGEDP